MDIVKRLRTRAEKIDVAIANSRVVVDLLKPQMDAFEQRTGHNIYAVRMAVDHENSIRRDEKETAELREAADTIEALCEAWQEYFAAVETLADLERNNDTTKRFDDALYAKERAENKARAALAKAGVQ